MMYVRVVVPIAVNREFTYLVPEGMSLKKGSVVRVPFRKGRIIGVVIGRAEPFEKSRYVLEHLFDLPEDVFKTAEFVIENYLAYPGEVFQFILPPFRKRAKFKIFSGNKESPFILTYEQRRAVDEILKIGKGVFLIHGITGSGKTEVYFHVMEEVLKQGKSILYLVPEIGMVPQTLERVRRRFGRGEEYHSKLTPGERMKVWFGTLDGDIDIVVGARMAVFLPMQNLGLIVVDEEHDTSYRQSAMRPYYSARDIAVFRGKLLDIPVILGSATPSVESYYKAQRGDYQLLELKERIGEAKLPDVEIVNLRKRQLISEELIKEIEGVKGRVIIFLNRRGYSPFVICRKCGYIEKCPDCDIPLTYHKEKGIFLCHHCNYTKKAYNTCPVCGEKLEFSSIGTERVEEKLREIFGEGIARMDRDALRKRLMHREIYSGLKNGSIRILVGTQMVTKGLDLPDVGLVVVLRADSILNFPDFRAGERTFQLLSQVAGRAGRQESGRVIIQTYFPEHYVIKAAKEHDFKMFYEKEIEFRKKSKYPPFTYLGRVVVEGENLRRVQDVASHIAEELKRYSVRLLGPSICPVKKRAGRYRYHILLKGDNRKNIVEALSPLIEMRYQNIKLIVETDPLDLL